MAQKVQTIKLNFLNILVTFKVCQIFVQSANKTNKLNFLELGNVLYGTTSYEQYMPLPVGCHIYITDDDISKIFMC